MRRLRLALGLAQELARQGKWYLIPILVVLLLLSALLVFSQGSALAPFIYTIF
jgi:hypothetical protein